MTHFTTHRASGDALMVHFNVYVSARTWSVDAADMYMALLSEIRNSNSEPLAGLVIDEDSITIEGE